MSVEYLFLDLATVTSGYAAGSLRGVEGYGIFELPKTFDNIGQLMHLGRMRIEALVNRFQPAEIAFESPFINRRIDTIMKVRKLAGLANVAEEVAFDHGVPCQEATTDDICRHFLGRGYPRRTEPKKMATKVKCREFGWDIHDDNDADALAGLSYMLACKHPRKALETVPMARFFLPAA